MTGVTKSHSFFAICLIILGIVLLLDNLGIATFGQTVGTWWPLLLVILGLDQLFASRFTNLFSWGLILVGIILQLRQLGLLHPEQLRAAWAILLILIGIGILFGFSRSKASWSSTSPQDFVNSFIVFGGTEQHITSSDFRGGNATAIFGGIDFDLTGAQLAEGVQTMSLQAFFGGIDLIVPEGWSVEIRGIPFFGGIEDSRHHRVVPQGESRQKLVINAMAIFGGVEIKN